MFIVAIVLVVIAAIAVAVRVVGGAREAGPAAAAATLLAVVATLVASVSVVPTRNVGIVRQFSTATGDTTGAGMKMHAPWQSIDDWDASGQTYARLNDGCLWVAIAAQRRACIPVQIEWNSNAKRAPENWAAYKEVDGIEGGRFGTFVARRVGPQMDAAITSVFASFDPLGAVDARTGEAPAPDLNKSHREPLLSAIKASLGEDVEVRSIAFQTPVYDKATTDAINAYGQKILEGRNLAVDEANAKTRARITATDASVNQTARCLQVAEKLGREPGLCMNPMGALALTGQK